MMNCPFYGRAMFCSPVPTRSHPPFVLFRQDGNQCALVLTSHSPCRMEIAGETPDWKDCILVKEIRMEETV
jgi:hypothetical protein